MCHNSIFCVIPPHILRHIAQNGDDDHKQVAMQTLQSSERLRGHRDILAKYNMAVKPVDGLYRVIQTADNHQLLTGSIIRKEGEEATGDPATDEAYNYLGDVYNFYKDIFGRNSIDNQGMKLFGTIHFGHGFDNAFWNGERMVFGDGDNRIFTRFTKAPEVIGHEMTHGVTNSSAALVYQGESGSLNESISDIFGSMVKQWILNQHAEKANWIIGEGLFMPNINGKGVRDLSAPGTAYDDPLLGKDPCPANMSDYVKGHQDNGGVHINCTIPSHAFYLASVELKGPAWHKMGRVWYNTLTRRLGKQSSFQEFADMTLKVCNRVFGQGSLEHQALNNAWKKVGVI